MAVFAIDYIPGTTSTSSESLLHLDSIVNRRIAVLVRDNNWKLLSTAKSR